MNDRKRKRKQNPMNAFRRSTVPKKLTGRRQERTKILEFLASTADRLLPGAMYISGCPGTGKTALIKEILAQRDQKEIIFVNCMTVTPLTVFSTILSALELKGGSDELESYLHSSITTTILVLDEIDSLFSQTQKTLYTLFQWANDQKTKLVLIGIANSLDLTTRHLPRLITKNYEPEYLAFLPYTVEEIKDIIKARLDDSKPAILAPITNNPDIPLMQPMAIELTARKLAGCGDLRKALDLCHLALTMVTIKHVLKATEIMFGNSTKQRIKELPMQSKLILALIVLAKNVQTTVEIHSKYRKVIFKTGIDEMSLDDTIDVVGQLENKGLVTLMKGKIKSDIDVLQLNEGIDGSRVVLEIINKL